MFVDYAGAKIPVYGRRTGEAAVSFHLRGRPGRKQLYLRRGDAQPELPCWIGSHIRALEFYGGVPEIAVPDNTRPGSSGPAVMSRS